MVTLPRANRPDLERGSLSTGYRAIETDRGDRKKRRPPVGKSVTTNGGPDVSPLNRANRCSWKVGFDSRSTRQSPVESFAGESWIVRRKDEEFLLAIYTIGARSRKPTTIPVEER